MNENESATTIEVARILEVSPQTIRRLCDSGLVPQVKRIGNKYSRRFEPWQIDLLQVLIGLKQCGLSKTDLRRYSRLFRQGDVTLAERKALLATRKRQLWQELEERQKAIDFIERQEEVIEQEIQAGEDHATK